MVNLGVIQEDAVARFYFSTAAADGGEEAFSATLEEADVVVMKDGAAMTLDASTITVTSIATGIYELDIDTSNDADFTKGSTYWVYVDPNDETIDSQAVSGVLGLFSIETASEKALRLLRTYLYPTDSTISTTTSNSTTAINLTDIVDANSDQVAGEILAVHDATDDQVELVRVTAWAYPQATVVCLDGTAMDFTVAAGDHVWRVGQFTATDGSLDALATSEAQTTAQNDLDIITGTAGVVLDDDAITSAKYDQSTAFPMADSNGAALTEAGGTGDHLTAIVVASLAAQAKADVNAEADAAIETYHLDHLLAADYDPGAKPGTATALLNELVESDGGVSRFTANALEEAPTGGSAPTADEIADAVWDEAKAGHVAAGSFGEEVQAHALTSEVSAVGDDTDEILTRLPDATAGGNGGLPTVDANNRIAGIAGTITTLDALDTAQDTQHSTTQTAVAALPTDADVETAAEAAIADTFGIVTGSVNDAAATADGFTVTDDAGADIRLGTLRLTSGTLAGESRLVTWTGTTVAVVEPTSVPAGLTTIGPFSAAPANGVTYTFRPL